MGGEAELQRLVEDVSMISVFAMLTSDSGNP